MPCTAYEIFQPQNPTAAVLLFVICLTLFDTPKPGSEVIKFDEFRVNYERSWKYR